MIIFCCICAGIYILWWNGCVVYCTVFDAKQYSYFESEAEFISKNQQVQHYCGCVAFISRISLAEIVIIYPQSMFLQLKIIFWNEIFLCENYFALSSLWSSNYLRRLVLGYHCFTLEWRHNERNWSQITRVSIVYSHFFFRRRPKKILKPRVTGEFPAQRASNVENYSIWWRHHETDRLFFHGSRAFAENVSRWYQMKNRRKLAGLVLCAKKKLCTALVGAILPISPTSGNTQG